MEHITIYEYHNTHSLQSPTIIKLYVDGINKTHYWIGDEKILLVRSGVTCFTDPSDLIYFSRNVTNVELIRYTKALVKAKLNVGLANELSERKLINMVTEWY